MNRSLRAALLSSVALVTIGAIAGVAQAQTAPQADPPGRVGRLAYTQGTVSFHDAQQDSWSPASANTPITSGDSLWTEPNGHDEIAVAGSRVRMDGDTQLDALAIDDSQTRLQLDQGRLDIKTFAFDNSQPYQIVTPRGTVTLEQQGDYYIHAGSTDDPTLIGVRAGAAQLQTPDGQVLALRAGEVGEASGADNAPALQTIHSPPPAMPAYWAQRDQQIAYAPPQYVSADVTGYEDLAAYGSWSNDPQYGEVWSPNAPPAGWEPYRTGHWSYVAPWGWTWIDSQPWGYAPYHYGRWARREDRWYWVPPQRNERAVYAPALVAFVGGLELGVLLGEQRSGPVGWFPLGPREAYVPPYSNDRNYYNRINADARVDNAALNDRWQRAERHEALTANQPNEPAANRRFATVVSAEDFAHSRPVQQAALKVSADKLATAPVAPVAAPPAPNRAIASAQQPNARPQAQAPNAPANGLATGQTRLANMEEIGRPAAAQHPAAPGPKIAARASEPAGKPGLPPLSPRVGTPPPRIEGERTPAEVHPAPAAPQANRAEPPHVTEPVRNEPARNEPARGEPAHNEPARPAEAHAAPAPPHPAETPRPEQQRVEPQRAEPQREAMPQAPHPATPPPQAVPPAPHPAAPPAHAEAPHAEPPHAEAPHVEAHAPPPPAPKKEDEKK